MNKDNIPVFKITIDDIYAEDGEDLGYNKIAHTFKPAIKLKGAAFSAQVKKLFFADDVKMRIAAPLMIPSKIYRYDEDTEDEYYVEFTAEVIEQMYKKFMLNLENQEIFNDEHDDSVVQSYILESFLVDSEVKKKMVKEQYDIDVPLGSVFIVAQVKDKETFDYLVENEKLGFSIEGFLGMKLTEVINKKEKMKKNKFNLPTGKHLIGNQYFTVDEDGEIVSVEASEEKEDEMSEEEKEDEMSEEEKEETLESNEKEEETLESDEKEEELESDEEKEEFEALTMEQVLEAMAPIHEDLINRIAELEAKIELANEEEVEEEKTVMKTNLSEILKKASKFTNIR
jgi:hypothetical protein